MQQSHWTVLKFEGISKHQCLFHTCAHEAALLLQITHPSQFIIRTWIKAFVTLLQQLVLPAEVQQQHQKVQILAAHESESRSWLWHLLHNWEHTLFAPAQCGEAPAAFWSSLLRQGGWELEGQQRAELRTTDYFSSYETSSPNAMVTFNSEGKSNIRLTKLFLSFFFFLRNILPKSLTCTCSLEHRYGVRHMG